MLNAPVLTESGIASHIRLEIVETGYTIDKSTDQGRRLQGLKKLLTCGEIYSQQAIRDVEFTMARHEQDREDWMREATALVRRVEVHLPDYDAPCVIGFRRGGEGSVFVGADPVFQFNACGEIRRGYWNGRPLKAEFGRLVQLERRRTETESLLVRHELTDSQQSEFLQLARKVLRLLQRDLLGDDLNIVKRFPSDFDAAGDLTNWLGSLPDPLVIAAAPNVAG